MKNKNKDKDKNNIISFPSKVSKKGAASEGYSFSLKSISNLNKSIKIKHKNISFLDTEMIEKFIDKNSLRSKHLIGSKYEIKNLRLTLDYQEDYLMIKKIFDKLGSYSSRRKINNFLKKNKYIKKINNFRNIDWIKNQKKILRYQKT